MYSGSLKDKRVISDTFIKNAYKANILFPMSTKMEILLHKVYFSEPVSLCNGKYLS